MAQFIKATHKVYVPSMGTLERTVTIKVEGNCYSAEGKYVTRKCQEAGVRDLLNVLPFPINDNVSYAGRTGGRTR